MKIKTDFHSILPNHIQFQGWEFFFIFDEFSKDSPKIQRKNVLPLETSGCDSEVSEESSF